MIKKLYYSQLLTICNIILQDQEDFYIILKVIYINFSGM